jgi:addiction module HigA family antidote
MAMHNPPHPGEVILEDFFKPLGLTISEAARRLGVSRNRLSRVCHGKARITPELALRLEMAFKPSADSWIGQQAVYDLYQIRKKNRNLRVIPCDPGISLPAH